MSLHQVAPKVVAVEVAQAALHEAGHVLACILSRDDVTIVASVFHAFEPQALGEPLPVIRRDGDGIMMFSDATRSATLWTLVGEPVAGVCAEYPSEPETAMALLTMLINDND